MADWAGKTLGKVKIAELIARGGMAEVYTGNYESFGQVAVKVMRGLLDRDSEQLARFQREAEVVEGLRHPNIVQMYEYDIVDESPFLVMEYIPGPSLAAYLKSLHDNKQRLPIGMVAQLLRSIASALDYAHSKGIVHRDIKPDNILIDKAGQVKITGSGFKKEYPFIVRVSEYDTASWHKLGRFSTDDDGEVSETFKLPNAVARVTALNVCLKSAVNDSLICKRVFRQ